jgi:hypothetical protein
MADLRPVPSVAAAALTGDRAATLRALRDRIAAEVDAGVPPRDLAALSARLMAIAAELDHLDSGKETSPLDSFLSDPAAGSPGPEGPPAP